jgi:hypothetical protein
VVDVQPAPFAGELRTEWFQWCMPPGATEMRLPVTGACSLWVDGEAVEIVDGKAAVPHPAQSGKTATLCVQSEGGPGGGALFFAPVTYDTGVGEILLGDWSDQGLEAWSGGVRYRCRVNAADGMASSDGRLLLDLGRVRGTAEVWVNGQNAGVRFLSPYRFEITGLVHPSENEIEVLILNTLAPYLAHQSPTHFIGAGQTASGILGPVRILAPATGTKVSTL